jgi:hypothetical protein
MFILRDSYHIRQKIVLAQLVSATGTAIFHELIDRQKQISKITKMWVSIKCVLTFLLTRKGYCDKKENLIWFLKNPYSYYKFYREKFKIHKYLIVERWILRWFYNDGAILFNHRFSHNFQIPSEEICLRCGAISFRLSTIMVLWILTFSFNFFYTFMSFLSEFSVSQNNICEIAFHAYKIF